MVTRESAASGAPDCAGRKGAHTPGPWVKDRRGQLCGSNGKQIGTWDAGIAWVGRDAESEANARLIAAAPELALAASAAERKLVELRSLLADHGISCACTDEIVLLQDALIKAGV